jgi:hypothetical protein
LTGKVRAFEVPPPGAGFTTVTDTVPAWAMSAAVMAAVSWVPLTTVVVRLAPFHCTAALETKFAPVTIRVKASPPAVVLAGASALSAGTGFADVVTARVNEVVPVLAPRTLM